MYILNLNLNGLYYDMSMIENLCLVGFWNYFVFSIFDLKIIRL